MKKNTKKTIGFFLKHIGNFKFIAIALIVLLTIGVSIDMSFPLFYKEFFNAMVGDGEKSAIVKELILIIIIIFSLDLFNALIWRISGFLNNRFQPKIMANIINECFEYIHSHSYNFFNNNFTGAIVKKIHRLAHAFEGIADKVYWNAIPLILRMTIIFGVLTYLNLILGGIILAWILIFTFLSYLVAKYKVKFDLKRAKYDTKVTAYLSDTITNSINVKLFSGLLHEVKKFKKITGGWSSRMKKSWDIEVWIEAVQAVLMVILEVIMFYIAIVLWEKDLLTVGDFVLIQAYLLAIFLNVWNLGRLIRDVYENFADAEEMIIILNIPHEVKDSSYARELIVTRGKVEFKNVAFAYENSKDVINKLSFKIKPGEKVALIGPSGGGKTTIVKLLLRLFDIKKGKILIDENNIANVKQESLRENISLVPQDPILFHRTLMENIRYGRRSATNQEVIAAAKLAYCHEFIMKSPHGYNTYVGERGVKLSGGERQRVAIARAILSNTKILILDEATSQLDSESEKLIQEALRNLIKNKTTFVIAHRLSTVMTADRVFVIKEGKIIEEGSHTSLVIKKDGLYKKLWDLQVGGYLEE